MSEPEYLAQTGEPMTWEERNAWILARRAEAKARGCTFGRISTHPDNRDLLLIEGWKERPDDQGEPRFQFQATSSGQ